MNRSQILKEINDIFIEIIEDKDVVLSESTTAEDIDEWDSLTHIQIIVSLEKHFKLRFESQEIQEWKNIADIINSVIEKL
mgnify:CR=1 FL=1